MPPRNTNPFAVADQANEVVCPLKNNDGTHCRKRCLGDKRFRSMQEHIRRAHPEHYIPKLPATEESFALMVNTPPSERPQQPQQSLQHSPPNAMVGAVGPPADFNSLYKAEFNYPTTLQRTSDDFRRGSLLPTANAAEVLAQLHAQQPNTINWEQEHAYGEMFTDSDAMGPRLPPIDPPTDPRLYSDDRYPDPSRPRDLLPSTMNRSPPYYRSSTLPPAGRTSGSKPSRPRKSSISQNARKPKHERTKSKDHQRRMSYDRKAMSAEPSSLSAMIGKRWEDLIDAAASATEEDSRDLTPVPGSPKPGNRASLPPLLSAPQFQNHTYTASPLQRALTPPPPENHDLAPFPSVESSVDSSKSGANFHMSTHGLSDSSPSFIAGPVHVGHVQLYCAGCHRLSMLRDSYACTECICGLCKECVDAICSEQSRRRAVGCPKCNAFGGKFKPFQLDIR